MFQQWCTTDISVDVVTTMFWRTSFTYQSETLLTLQSFLVAVSAVRAAPFASTRRALERDPATT